MINIFTAKWTIQEYNKLPYILTIQIVDLQYGC